MASEPRNYPDYVFVAYDEDFSAQTYDIAVSLEPGNLVGRPVKYIRHDLNTRPAPAATDTGLVTVEYQVRSKLNGHWVKDNFLSQQLSPDTERRELVTRSQAEAIIAAKNATLQDAIECVKVLTEEKNKLEADNAALIHDLTRIKDHETELVNDNAAMDARIKELETELENGGRVKGVNTQYANALAYLEMTEDDDPEEFAKRTWDERKALEAKLAAAEKALEPFANAADGRKSKSVTGSVCFSQHYLLAARAALGGKP